MLSPIAESLFLLPPIAEPLFLLPPIADLLWLFGLQPKKANLKCRLEDHRLKRNNVDVMTHTLAAISAASFAATSCC